MNNVYIMPSAKAFIPIINKSNMSNVPGTYYSPTKDLTNTLPNRAIRRFTKVYKKS
jgi:hypothetical protein